MKIAIFGATGRTGRLVVEQALNAGYEVIAFARTPEKIVIQDERLSEGSREPLRETLSIVRGDIQDGAQVETAVTGADAVISTLGPTRNVPEYQVSKGTANILAAMKKQDVRRLIISAGAGVGDPNDEPKFFNKVISLLLNLVSRHVVEDMKRVVDLVRTSDRDWTIVRVPMLTDDPATGEICVGYVGKGTGYRLSRADMADFMLRQLEDDNYVRKAPMISN